MPSTICTIISSVAAAIIGLLSAPFLNEYGLAPYYSTISSQSTHIPAPSFFDDELFLHIHKPYMNTTFATPTSSADAFPGTTVDFGHKRSSSTATSPPTSPPTPISAKSFYRNLFFQLVSHLLSILAGLSLRLVSFCKANPTTSYDRLVVIKRRNEYAHAADLSMSDISTAYQFEPITPTMATTSDDMAVSTSTSVPPSPTSQEPAWGMSGITNFYASSPKATTNVDKGTEVPTSLPPTPAPAAAGRDHSSLPSQPPKPGYNHDAAPFNPMAGSFIPRPVGPSTDTPVQFAQKFKYHGTKGPGF
ncbi:MAG: hypothetical protein Q9184_004590 [Pyrenodesmia sp. 2 TL-2023]